MPVAEASLPAGYHSMVKDEFPDGARVTELDVPNRALMIEESDGTEREVPFDYETPGARIYSMAKGPDGVIYGGTGHPTYVFRFDVETGDLRAMQHSGGHVNAIATQGDKVYLAMYAGGAIYEYDVSMPWAPDDEANPNPVRVVEHGRPEIVRPSALKAHPDGRHLIMAGSPRGGRTAGGLFIYDIEQQAGELISHADLLENLNTRGLVALPNGDLVGTTTTRPGTGGQRRADEAELYILDWENRKVAWRETILPDEELGDLILGPDGLVYGITVDATLFVFDPEARKLLHEESLSEYGEPAGSQAPRHVARGADDEIYMLFEEAIVSLSPGSFEHRKLAESPDEIRVGIVVDGDRIYFSSYTDLWSYQIP